MHLNVQSPNIHEMIRWSVIEFEKGEFRIQLASDAIVHMMLKRISLIRFEDVSTNYSSWQKRSICKSTSLIFITDHILMENMQMTTRSFSIDVVHKIWTQLRSFAIFTNSYYYIKTSNTLLKIKIIINVDKYTHSLTLLSSNIFLRFQFSYSFCDSESKQK